MLDLPLKYDPNISIDGFLVGAETDPTMAASYMKSGYLPRNLVNMSEISTNFRDAVIHSLIATSDGNEAERVVQLLSAAVSATPDDMTNTVKAYSEYLAPLSFVWGETVVATRAILRNKPDKAGNFLSTVANALNKRMNSEMFKSLIVSSTTNAADIVAMEIAQGKY